MAFRISNAMAKAMLDAGLDLLDSGTIEVRTGSAPTTVEDAATGTLLATLGFNATAFPASADGTDKATATANAITSDTDAAATGTAGYFRGKSSGGTAHCQGSVTASGGGGDMELNTVSIQQHATVACTAFVVNLPET